MAKVEILLPPGTSEGLRLVLRDNANHEWFNPGTGQFEECDPVAYKQPRFHIGPPTELPLDQEDSKYIFELPALPRLPIALRAQVVIVHPTYVEPVSADDMVLDARGNEISLDTATLSLLLMQQRSPPENGPVPPESFLWNGVPHRAPGNRYKMLTVLWAPRSVTDAELGSAIWGEDWDDTKLSTTVNRLNQDLCKTPWRVRRSGGVSRLIEE